MRGEASPSGGKSLLPRLLVTVRCFDEDDIRGLPPVDSRQRPLRGCEFLGYDRLVPVAGESLIDQRLQSLLRCLCGKAIGMDVGVREAPQTGRLILRPGRQARPIGAEGNGCDNALMPLQ